MRRYLELPRLGRWPLDRSDVPVVSGNVVRRCQRKRRLEIRLASVPVDDISKLNALSGITGGEADGLNEARARSLTGDFNGHADRASFDDPNFRRAGDERFRRSLLLIPVHVPRRPLPRIIMGNREACWSRENFFANRLIEDAGHVAV